MTTKSVELRQRLHRSSLRAAQLDGVRQADTERQTQLTADVAAAKARLGLAEEVSRTFDALQARAYERSVGGFERLLSAFLQDVLPEEGKVRLLPQFKSGTTWLDVALEKDGALEDIVDGNGGAVTNVVCTGLRFTALFRTKNRRLMILDEPDCWLKPERVPAFVQVVAEVAQQTNTQTFYITHHLPEFFEGKFNVVRFARDAQDPERVVAMPLAPLVSEWTDDEAPGIRAIELVNFRRHVHTVVPCFPGATAFIGDNNLGKSTAVVSAFKAVAYGESDDSMIRHGCEEARVVIHLEQGRRIEWSRSNKRSPAVIYRLYEKGSDTPVQEGRPKTRNQAPEWVTQVLGISRVDDLDIQVGNQKSPVFLLNDSAPRRAQILSVGRESGYLKMLMKAYDERKAADRETVRSGEAQLARLSYRLQRLAALDAVNDKLSILAIEYEDALDDLESRETLEKAIERLAAAHERVAACEREVNALAGLPALPELADVAQLERLMGVIERSSRLLATVRLPEMPAVPELSETEAIVMLGQRLATSAKLVAILSKLPESVPELPQLQEVQELEKAMTRLAQQERLVAAAQAEDAQSAKELAAVQREVEALKEELGGECPLCGATLPEHGIEHHAHEHVAA